MRWTFFYIPHITNKEGKFVQEWPSIKIADEVGFTGTNICSCLKGKRKTHKGFSWKYKN